MVWLNCNKMIFFIDFRQQIQYMQNQFMETDIQVTSPAEMKIRIKQNQALINHLGSSIRKKQAQMKQFSQEMTKMIQKKLIPKNQSQYSHPNFNPQYSTPHLQQLHSKKQQLYAQISKLKQQISAIVSQQEPEVINEVRKKQSMILSIAKETMKMEKQKLLLEESLGKNKLILEGYQNSQCLREIQENQVQLDEVKREIRELEKDIKMWMNQDISISLYANDVNKDLQYMENPPQPSDQIDAKEFEQLGVQIQKILQQKKMADRQYIARRQQINRKIKQMMSQNARLQREVREIIGMDMQRELQRKKKQIISRNKSVPQISTQQRQEKPKKKQRNFISPTLLLTQPQRVKQKQKKNNNGNKNSLTVIIGTWKLENLIKDDIIESRNISRAIGLKVRTKDRKITGMGVTYIDKVGVEVLGRSNIWKLSDDTLETGEEEFFIDLQDVVELYYNSPSAVGQNTSGIPIGLKFISKTSRPIIKVGQILNEQQVELIDLNSHFIKTVEFTLDNNYKQISGIRLNLCEVEGSKKQKNENIFESQQELQESKDNYHFEESQHKQEIKNDVIMPSKWLSTASQGGLTQKKVFLKSPSKKLNDIPQVDHRLMLNRKKKMV